jgi:hypothetical protein
MNRSSFAILSIVASTSLLMATSLLPKGLPTPPKANSYADWLVLHVGRHFYLSADWTVAIERTKTTAVPAGEGKFELTGVGEDFAWFENKSDRVCVPLAALRVVLGK